MGNLATRYILQLTTGSRLPKDMEIEYKGDAEEDAGKNDNYGQKDSNSMNKILNSISYCIES